MRIKFAKWMKPWDFSVVPEEKQWSVDGVAAQVEDTG